MIHIHNGDVVAAVARRADIPGEHLVFRESLVTGPVVEGEQWIETRARTIAAAHPHDLLRVRTDLVEQEQALAAAAEGNEEIVLWFEHDLFCLIHIVHLIQRFPRSRLSWVWRSSPLAEADERELGLLFESRAAVSPSVANSAKSVWNAYASSDPTALNQWLGRDVAEFPFLREGLSLHASRFPSTQNGLGSIEQRALTMIASGTAEFATLFDTLNGDVPRLGFGDSEILRHLRVMASCAVPLITMAEEGGKVICAITPAGENVLRGEVDDVVINDPDLWLGGAHLTPSMFWRWNGATLIPDARIVN